jgi:hypothetical protein
MGVRQKKGIYRCRVKPEVTGILFVKLVAALEHAAVHKDSALPYGQKVT